MADIGVGIDVLNVKHAVAQADVHAGVVAAAERP
jgi:hypothetical protein